MNTNLKSLVSLGAALVSAPLVRSLYNDPLAVVGLQRRGSPVLSNLMFAIGGAVVGGGIALLFAPQSGAQTRKQIERKTQDLSREVKALAAKTGEAIEEQVGNAVVSAKRPEHSYSTTSSKVS
jgi:YtxH-like protein